MKMTMNMPQNYVELDQEEMMYLDGGWSASTFYKSASRLASHAYQLGIGIVGAAIYDWIKSNRSTSFTKAVAKLAGTAWKAFRLLPWWAQVAAGVGGAAVIWAMGTWVLF